MRRTPRAAMPPSGAVLVDGSVSTPATFVAFVPPGPSAVPVFVWVDPPGRELFCWNPSWVGVGVAAEPPPPTVPVADGLVVAGAAAGVGEGCWPAGVPWLPCVPWVPWEPGVPCVAQRTQKTFCL